MDIFSALGLGRVSSLGTSSARPPLGRDRSGFVGNSHTHARAPSTAIDAQSSHAPASPAYPCEHAHPDKRQALSGAGPVARRAKGDVVRLVRAKCRPPLRPGRTHHTRVSAKCPQSQPHASRPLHNETSTTATDLNASGSS
eukprot:scaffold2674_cov333-Prasinococcus_capsulatus_cf.AAC.2